PGKHRASSCWNKVAVPWTAYSGNARCGSLRAKRLAMLDSGTSSSNAKKAPKTAALSRLFSPMSSLMVRVTESSAGWTRLRYISRCSKYLGKQKRQKGQKKQKGFAFFALFVSFVSLDLN